MVRQTRSLSLVDSRIMVWVRSWGVRRTGAGFFPLLLAASLSTRFWVSFSALLLLLLHLPFSLSLSLSLLLLLVRGGVENIGIETGTGIAIGAGVGGKAMKRQGKFAFLHRLHGPSSSRLSEHLPLNSSRQRLQETYFLGAALGFSFVVVVIVGVGLELGVRAGVGVTTGAFLPLSTFLLLSSFSLLSAFLILASFLSFSAFFPNFSFSFSFAANFSLSLSFLSSIPLKTSSILKLPTPPSIPPLIPFSILGPATHLTPASLHASHFSFPLPPSPAYEHLFLNFSLQCIHDNFNFGGTINSQSTPASSQLSHGHSWECVMSEQLSSEERKHVTQPRRWGCPGVRVERVRLSVL